LGDEPSGLGWTGFQSITNARSGYVLIFREDNPRSQRRLALYGGEGGCRYRLTHLLGAGADTAGTSTVTLGTAATAPAGIRVDHVVTADGDGCIEFAILQPRSFALYRYEIADGAVRLLA